MASPPKKSNSMLGRWKTFWLQRKKRVLARQATKKRRKNSPQASRLKRAQDNATHTDSDGTSNSTPPQSNFRHPQLDRRSQASVKFYLENADQARCKLGHRSDVLNDTRTEGFPDQSVISILTMDPALTNRLGMETQPSDSYAYVGADTSLPFRRDSQAYEMEYDFEYTSTARDMALSNRLYDQEMSMAGTLDDETVYTSMTKDPPGQRQATVDYRRPEEELSVVAEVRYCEC